MAIVKQIIQTTKQAAKDLMGIVDSAEEIRGNEYALGYDAVSVSMLLGTGQKKARSRIQILEKYHLMMGDPIISTALRTHVTQALGGHETTGDTIFIEAKPDAKGPDRKRVQEISAALAPLLNEIAHGLCFNAAGFGDAYARIFTKPGQGVVGLYTGEMILPPLVQSYERANTTTGFVVTTGEKANEKLTVLQMARMKMPRMQYVPQLSAMLQAQRIALREDDPDKWPHMPALVNGSFLDSAEDPYDRFVTGLAGLLSTRILSSQDESLLTVNTDGMTLEQQKLFMGSLGNMLQKGKDRARKLIEKGQFSTERTVHLMPVSGEKQITQVQAFQGSGSSSTISIEDLMLYARLLSGAIGIDLSILGFADQLSGGLGDGGFMRTSIQAAERSEIIRTALTQFIDHVVDVHCLVLYGEVFPTNARPYRVNFYGATSALERETQESRERATNSAVVLLQVFQMMLDQGLPEEMIIDLLTHTLQLDEEYAKQLAQGLKKAKPKDDGGGSQDFGGGSNFGSDTPGAAANDDIEDDE